MIEKIWPTEEQERRNFEDGAAFRQARRNADTEAVAPLSPIRPKSESEDGDRADADILIRNFLHELTSLSYKYGILIGVDEVGIPKRPAVVEMTWEDRAYSYSVCPDGRLSWAGITEGNRQ